MTDNRFLLADFIGTQNSHPQLREYCPRAFGTWAIFPQLREIIRPTSF